MTGQFLLKQTNKKRNFVMSLSHVQTYLVWMFIFITQFEVEISSVAFVVDKIECFPNVWNQPNTRCFTENVHIVTVCVCAYMVKIVSFPPISLEDFQII